MPTPPFIRIAVWLWLIAALLVGRFQLLQRLPLPAVPGILAALTAGLLLLYFLVRAVRSWIDRLDLRALVLLHITRYVGFYFLLMDQRGLLPHDFAVPAGWGDIIAATLALGVCLLPLGAASQLRAITIWNVVGFLDILMVVISAGRLALQGDPQIRALTVLPLSLLPTFLVPLILSSHVVIFLRLRAEVPAP